MLSTRASLDVLALDVVGQLQHRAAHELFPGNGGTFEHGALVGR
jgi:hypothetical protein